MWFLSSGSSNGHSPVLNLSKSGGGSGGEHSGSEAGHTGPEDDEDDDNVSDADEEDEKDQGKQRNRKEAQILHSETMKTAALGYNDVKLVENQRNI